jgi:hypothetical protein
MHLKTGGSMSNESQESKQIQIQTTDEMSRGRYSNLMFASHSPDEFILDWLFSTPNGVHLISRIILTPGNVKRAIEALKSNLKSYEEKFGPVNSGEPDEQKVH